MERIEVWIIHKTRKVLVTDDPGVPTAVCGYVSADAAQAADARGYPTVSEIGFNREDHRSFEEWNDATRFAKATAKELGYICESVARFAAWLPDDDDGSPVVLYDPDYPEFY